MTFDPTRSDGWDRVRGPSRQRLASTSKRARPLLAGAAVVATACGPGPAQGPSEPAPLRQVVAAVEETTPAVGRADDVAIWRDASEPSRSVLIGTDKDIGLMVYDLTGAELHRIEGFQPNNVDLRDGITLGGAEASIVVAGDDEEGSILVYRLDPATRSLVDVSVRRLTTDVKPYGLCLYREATSERLYVFAADEDGRVEQLELFDDGSGRIDARRVRGPWDVGGQVEGCVADDQLGVVYLGEEDEGVWRYGAASDEPTSERISVDTTSPGGHLEADVEGLALLGHPDGTGLLIASSQGDSSFVAYTREGENRFVKRFQVGPGEVDGCEETDGIEVLAGNLGPRFPKGLFVCHDGRNPGARSNFKLVPLERILEDR